MPPNRFILFALARTGSTTLMQLLNCHPDIHCLFEPFNPGNHAEYHRLVDMERRLWGLPSALDLLWQHCNGFKHVCHANGWPFDKELDLNLQLLRNPQVSVLLLGRKNLLQRAISVQISDQMQVWHTQTADDRRRIREHQFTALDIPRLRADMTADLPLLHQARQTLEASGTQWRKLNYEDFFDPRLPMDSRVQVVQSQFTFLGFAPLSDPSRLSDLRKLFDPDATGFQNSAAYHKIPNIHDVECQLGSSETGHVFDP